MKERPILFSAPMVRAILEGRKTQTRRVIKPEPKMGRDGFGPYMEIGKVSGEWPADSEWIAHKACSFGKPGDVLWVRESIKRRPMSNFLTGEPTNTIVAAYAADDEDVVEEAGFNLLPWWKSKGALPAIHMPRNVCRIILNVTDVRIQRLQNISEEDAWAEGCEGHDDDVTGGQSGYSEFAHLWMSINGEASWKANPWIWAISFEKAPYSNARMKSVVQRSDERSPRAAPFA